MAGYFDVDYCLGEVQIGIQTGTVRMKYVHPVVGKMNRFKCHVPEDVYDTAPEDFVMLHVPAQYSTRGRKRAHYSLLMAIAMRSLLLTTVS